MAGKYTHEQLVEKLDKPGWRTVTGKEAKPLEGSLRTLAQAAHARREKGHGLLQEIVTEIEVDMVQLQELWHHLGLPV